MENQPGPCKVCGALDYPMSYGGADICPACDCSCPECRQEALARRVLKLEIELKALKSKVRTRDFFGQ